MADDSLQAGTDTIHTDHVTTLNGAAVTQSATSPKVQVVKLAYGDDGVARHVSDAFPLPTMAIDASLGVQATAAAAAAVTLTLPAPAAGLFQHITEVRVVLYNTAARTGSATPVLVTTTNLPGTPSYVLPSAGAVGTIDRIHDDFTFPIKAAAAATAVTFVAPATTGVIWRLTAFYYNAA